MLLDDVRRSCGTVPCIGEPNLLSWTVHIHTLYRQTDRQTQRDRDRHKGTQTDTEGHKRTETERDRQRQTETNGDKQTDR